MAASAKPDPELLVLGAELSWACGRGGEPYSQLAELPTADERELDLADLFSKGLSWAQKLGGDDWLQEVHRQLRQHQQLRAPRGLLQGAGLDRALVVPPVVRILQHVACSGGTLINRCLAGRPHRLKRSAGVKVPSARRWGRQGEHPAGAQPKDPRNHGRPAL